MRKGEETINGSLHKIKVINQSSFTIGDTTGYTPYEGNGVARNIKIASQLHFKSYEETLDCWRIDPNLEYCDFLKAVNNRVLQKCFITLSVFREVYYRFPKAWDASDCYKFLEILKDKVG